MRGVVGVVRGSPVRSGSSAVSPLRGLLAGVLGRVAERRVVGADAGRALAAAPSAAGPLLRVALRTRKVTKPATSEDHDDAGIT